MCCDDGGNCHKNLVRQAFNQPTSLHKSTDHVVVGGVGPEHICQQVVRCGDGDAFGNFIYVLFMEVTMSVMDGVPMCSKRYHAINAIIDGITIDAML